MIDIDKARVLAKFEPESDTRILVSSEYLSHGKDVPDIDIVVIYGTPLDKEPSLFLQKFGRAARGPDHKGIAVVLGDAWCLEGQSGGHQSINTKSKLSQLLSHVPITSDPLDTSSPVSLSDSIPTDILIPSSPPVRTESLVRKQAKRRRKTNAEERKELPDVLLEFVNSGGCLRQPWLTITRIWRARHGVVLIAILISI
ncbi:hypothetical protein BGW36DRAFT_205301 [Talaromyces proteolyticus]|uniref:Helicase C-terminal domain-containing protein n=1 Tax=Talaromyces proteolyticus TaxID=1131652 RepID=A0AAD4KNN9_9EURO|nr:uncharacterized protein BGW36DRAFT_205301 [Talaromyces proteolyticus]KAH8695647.1 hypothetical protein BGW36DRAFT_205301 [Talaromyces proteolyticus]